MTDSLTRGPMDNPGEWLERQCEELDVSVARVAREAGLDRITLFRWKHGQRPYWDSVQRVQIVIGRFWDEKREKEGA